MSPLHVPSVHLCKFFTMSFFDVPSVSSSTCLSLTSPLCKFFTMSFLHVPSVHLCKFFTMSSFDIPSVQVLHHVFLARPLCVSSLPCLPWTSLCVSSSPRLPWTSPLCKFFNLHITFDPITIIFIFNIYKSCESMFPGHQSD